MQLKIDKVMLNRQILNTSYLNLLYILVLLVVVFTNTYIYSQYILNTDDFLLHEFAYQINQGKNLYVDIDYLLAPLSFYLLAIIQKIPGYNIEIYKTFVSIFACLNFLLLLWLCKIIKLNNTDTNLILLGSIFAHFFLIPTIWYGNLACIFVLLLLCMLAKSEGKGNLLINLTCGFISFIPILFKQNIGVFAILGFILISLFEKKKDFFVRLVGFTLALCIFIFIFSYIANLGFYEYAKVYFEYNFSLIQSSSTRAISVEDLIQKRFVPLIDFSSPFYGPLAILYLVMGFFAILLIYLKNIYIKVSLIFACILFTAYYMHINLLSNHAFLNINFLSIAFLLVMVICTYIKNLKILINKYILLIIIALFAILGAVLKGPWGVTEIFVLFFAIYAIFYSLFDSEKLKFGKVIITVLVFQTSIYNFSIFYGDYLHYVKDKKFQTFDYPAIKGFLFSDDRYQGMPDLIKWLEINSGSDEFFIFPPEDPIYLIMNRSIPVRVINSSKNVYPYSTDKLVDELSSSNIKFLIIKKYQTQKEANSFFSDFEKDAVYRYAKKEYTRVVYENFNYIVRIRN